VKIQIEMDVYDFKQIKFIAMDKPLRTFKRQVNKEVQSTVAMIAHMKLYNLVYCSRMNRFWGIGKLVKHLVK